MDNDAQASAQETLPENLFPKSEKKKKDKDKKKKASRTVETLFRALMSNHMQLSSHADSKANLMISVNAVILSVASTLIFKEIPNNMLLLLPSIVLVAVCLLTITYAILATKPSVKPPILENNRDLLFFGDYTQMSAEAYAQAMKVLITDDMQLHTSLINNIYAQGSVLNMKYRRLKMAYTIFMYGFPLAVILFLGAFVINP